MEKVLNDLIKAEKVNLMIEGEIEEFSKDEALLKAELEGLDLVQMDNKKIPLCKILDYNKYLYDIKKKNKKNNRGKKVKVKEIQLSSNIGEHDLKVKAKSADRMIKRGNKVRVVLYLRGREINNSDIGMNVVKSFEKLLSVKTKKKEIKFEGNNIVLEIE